MAGEWSICPYSPHPPHQALLSAPAQAMEQLMITPANGWTVFLDRDGTLIHDPGYLKDPQRVRLLPGVGKALAHLQRRGFYLVLVSNQSGIGRGLITEGQALQVHRQVLASLRQYGVRLHATYYCRHQPAEGCPCRKPMPGMLLRAAVEHGIELSRAFMIGDKPSDIEAGRRAGCRTILLTTTSEPDLGDPRPGATVRNWAEVVPCLERQVSVTG
jgi:histidinol-phosphate phosphatase family protein